jgi:hypothetical protein
MERTQHSRLGITSFVLCLVPEALFLCFLVEPLPFLLLSPLPFGGFGACWLIALTALAFGIAGIVQKGQKRLFAIIGTVLSTLELIYCALVLGLVLYE